MPRSVWHVSPRRRLALLCVVAAACGAERPAGGREDAAAPLSGPELQMAFPRAGGTATPIPGGRALVVGAMNGPASLVEVFDANTRAFAWGADATPRQDHAAVALADGSVLVVGGAHSAWAAMPDELFAPPHYQPRVVGSDVARRNLTATRLADGRVLVAGGRDTSGVALDTTRLYDPVLEEWVPGPRLALGSEEHSATRLQDGRVLLAGGVLQDGSISDRVEIVDPSTLSVTKAAPLNWPRAAHTASLLPDGRVLVAGGRGPGGLRAEAEIYDPARKAWDPAPPLTTPRAYHEAVTLANGDVLLLSGVLLGAGGYEEPAAAVERWVAVEQRFVAAPPLAVGRHAAAVALLPSGDILVAGGVAAGLGWQARADAELYHADAPCLPSCAPFTCGPAAPDGCGGFCGCGVGFVCDFGTCRDVAPPAVTIVSPPDGAIVGEAVRVTVAASDNDAIQDLWLQGNGWVDTLREGEGPFTFTWHPAPGSSSTSLDATAWDRSWNRTTSARVTFRVVDPLARLSSSLAAPLCGVTADCRSGELLHGRGAEERAGPSTLGGSCADSADPYQPSAGIHEIRIRTLDGTALAPGKVARVGVEVWDAYGRVEVWAATDASAPEWTLVGTGAAGVYMPYEVDLTIPSGGPIQAIRAHLVLDPATEPSPCRPAADWFEDFDDLAFAVEGGAAVPVARILSPADGARVEQQVQIRAEAWDPLEPVAWVDVLVDGLLVGGASWRPDLQAYALDWAAAYDAPGPHLLQAVAHGELGSTFASPPVTVDVGVWPPSVRIVSPRDGAVVGQQLKVRVEALDNEPVRQLQLLGQGVPGWPDPGPTAAGDGLFEFTWSPYPGLPSAELFAVAWDPYRSVESDRIHVRVAFPWASPAPALGAPRCPVTADCRTGDLVHGRGPTESESPNTLGGSCPDGGGYQYPGDIALHELRIHTLDGLALAAGKAARVEASIEAAYPGARLEVFVAPDASAPSWTFAGSADQAGPGWGSLALDLTVPAGGAVAAVRGRLVPLDEAGEPVACGSSPWQDVDDLAFALDVGGDVEPPTVALLEPADGAVLQDTAWLTVEAWDHYGLASVEAFVDGISIGAAYPYPPYQVAWDTRQAAQGPHAIWVVARDFDGHESASAPVAVTVDNDLVPPVAGIESPAEGAVLSATVPVQAFASDDRALAVVHLYACGQYVTSWYAPPFQTAWNTRQSPNGACTLTITAYDLAWNSFTASTSVTLDNDFTGPAVAITAPAAGAALSSAVDVQASATDPSGVARVELLASPGGGYTTLGSDASEPYAVTLDPRRLMLGAWTLQARATDSWGNVSLSAPVSVTVVDVTPPTVVLTAPAPGAVLGGDVALTATASDDRGISRVSWYASGRLVGSSYSPPYAYAWRTRDDPNGPSRLVARAVDGSGNVAEAEIQVSVLNDRAAPQVTLASPLAGATLTGSAVLTATATDDVGVTRVEFLDGSTVVGTDTTPPYETIWNVSGVAAGDHTLRARAYDAAGNMSSSAAVPVTVAPPFVPAATALYDAARRAPACNVATASCSSGSLLVGRSVLGPEPNPPNTIAGSCTDGTAGRFHYDESNDALKVSTADGTALASGKTVTIEATVWVWSYPSDWLDLYHSPSAGAPVWTLVRTIRPTANGLQRLSTTFVLPAGSTQVVRAVFRYGGSAGSCVPGSYNDHDDLVFTVR